jgi:hypothetical protein
MTEEAEKYRVEFWPERDSKLDTNNTKSGVKVTDLKTGAVVIVNRHRHIHANRREAIEILQKNRTTNEPYFTIDQRGWAGGGWSTEPVLKL